MKLSLIIIYHPPKLVKGLASEFPDSKHVYYLQLDAAGDDKIWAYAKENNFTIVTKDSDYEMVATLKGFPPCVVWLRMGNCTTKQIESSLLRNRELINSLSNQAGIIEIF